MRRRTFLGSCAAGLLADGAKNAAAIDPHFPSAAHQFVWRNWNLVPAGRIAESLRTKREQVLALASAMSLGEQRVPAAYESRLRFKALRRNWDFVPYEQIEPLLGMTRSDIQELPSQDAFYIGHLGPKPECAAVRVSGTVSSRPISLFRYSARPGGAQEERFAFIDRLSRPGGGSAQVRAILRDGIPLAEQFPDICRSDSRVGFEASLQYFYLPLDIREKIVSCRYMMEGA